MPSGPPFGGPPFGGQPIDQAANLLGALSLVITDRTAEAMAGAGGRPETAAVALSALVHFLDHPSVDRLRQVLGLTSSGTVRLVDRLVAAGYLERGPGPDGRTTSVARRRMSSPASVRSAWPSTAAAVAPVGTRQHASVGTQRHPSTSLMTAGFPAAHARSTPSGDGVDSCTASARTTSQASR